MNEPLVIALSLTHSLTLTLQLKTEILYCLHKDEQGLSVLLLLLLLRNSKSITKGKWSSSSVCLLNNMNLIVGVVAVVTRASNKLIYQFVVWLAGWLHECAEQSYYYTTLFFVSRSRSPFPGTASYYINNTNPLLTTTSKPNRTIINNNNNSNINKRVESRASTTVFVNN